MKVPTDKQIDFLTLQIELALEEYERYAFTPLPQLLADKRVNPGRVWGIDDKRGSVILRFAKGSAPRLKIPMELLFWDDARAGLPATWTCHLADFKSDFVQGASSVEPVFYLEREGDGQWHYIGCTGLDIQSLDRVRTSLEKSVKPTILLAEIPPPIEYLKNLQAFIAANVDDVLLNLDMAKGLDDWHPDKLLQHEDDKCEEIIGRLQKERCVIVQGPPGTGKTFLVAQITAAYAAQGKSVCVTALANKALIELVKNECLQKLLSSRRVRKTRLTTNEVIDTPGLQDATDTICGGGSVLLATYYKLSETLKELYLSKSAHPRYDLIVIEEASQAFLATIAGFSQLASEVLIVGDPMQLPPIIKGEEQAKDIHHTILKFAYGLESVVSNTAFPSFMLRDTYRLTDAGAKLTGNFYHHLLHSRSTHLPRPIPQSVSSYLPKNGGAKIIAIPMSLQEERLALSVIETIVTTLIADDAKTHIAVLAPYRATVRTLQAMLRRWTESSPGLTIETIDRIQGLTTDYTLLYIPSGASFAFDAKRFNVATSRAKFGTTIIGNRALIEHIRKDATVSNFLLGCEWIALEDISK